jgi:hypothetical protein
MEFAQLNTFVVAYNLHFPIYNIDNKKRLFNLIFNVMWKFIYQDYFKSFLQTSFPKEILKDHLWKTLKN